MNVHFFIPLGRCCMFLLQRIPSTCIWNRLIMRAIAHPAMVFPVEFTAGIGVPSEIRHFIQYLFFSMYALGNTSAINLAVASTSLWNGVRIGGDLMIGRRIG